MRVLLEHTDLLAVYQYVERLVLRLGHGALPERRFVS
jgi:hypothetical protein